MFDLCPNIKAPANEHWALTRLNEIAKEDWHVIDVGAGDGEPYTHFFLHRLGPSGLIAAFEPGPEHPQLDALVYGPCGKSVPAITYDVALTRPGDTGTRRVKYFEYWTLIPADDARNQCYKTATAPFNCAFMTLDEVLRDTRPVDFIKLDVDGYEYRVLQGAEDTIRKYSPLLLIELTTFTLENIGDKLEDMLTYLFNLGYVFELPNGKAKTLPGVRAQIPPGSSINAFARRTR